MALAEPGAAAQARTDAASGAPLRERELVALWLLGRVPERVLPWPLLRPGGRGPGPDVREAAFLLPDGVIGGGAVEVHVRARNFVAHGHERDPAYAAVAPHLVWLDDRAEAGAPQALPGGGSAPTVAVGPALGGEPGRLRALLRRGPSGLEPCAGAASRLRSGRHSPGGSRRHWGRSRSRG